MSSDIQVSDYSVSFVIPVYNAEKYIDRCLGSIFSQTYNDFEVILVDDGSSDQSVHLIKQWMNKYPGKITLIEQENLGAGIARDNGVKAARCPWIAHIDNDDFIDPDYLASFIKEARAGQYDLVLGGYRRVGANGKTLFSTRGQSEWSKYMIMAPWARIYKKSFIDEHNVEFFREGWAEDIYYNAQLYFCGARIKTIDYSGYNWWFNDNSVSNVNKRTPDKREDAIILTEAISKLPNIKKDRYYNLFMVRYLAWFLLWAQKNTTPEDFQDKTTRYFNWLRNQEIPVKFPIFSKIIKGEPIKNRIGINILILAERLNLLAPFSKVWCK